MISKSDLAQFLVGLVVANDADLIDDDSVLPPEICAADDRPAVRRLRNKIQCLYRDFDYLASPEFAMMANGKSEAYRAMLEKSWSKPEKRTQQRREFANSMAALLSNDHAYQLTSSEHHWMLDELRDGFGSIANPDGNNPA